MEAHLRKISFCSLVFLILNVGCGKKLPPITACVYEKSTHIFRCVDKTGKAFNCGFDEDCADKMVAIPFQDTGILLQYCQGLKP